MSFYTQQEQNPEQEIEIGDKNTEELIVSNSPEENNEKSDNFIKKILIPPVEWLFKMAGLELSKCHYISLSVNISAV